MKFLIVFLDKDPDFMVWLGDNVYLRTPDFLTERGIRHRYRHARATKEVTTIFRKCTSLCYSGMIMIMDLMILMHPMQVKK